MTTSVASRQTKPSDHVPQKDGNIEDSAKEESFKQDLNFLCNHCEHKTTDEKQFMQHVKSNHKGFKCDYWYILPGSVTTVTSLTQKHFFLSKFTILMSFIV